MINRLLVTDMQPRLQIPLYNTVPEMKNARSTVLCVSVRSPVAWQIGLSCTSIAPGITVLRQVKMAGKMVQH